jgi:hypothetical protein
MQRIDPVRVSCINLLRHAEKEQMLTLFAEPASQIHGRHHTPWPVDGGFLFHVSYQGEGDSLPAQWTASMRCAGAITG